MLLLFDKTYKLKIAYTKKSIVGRELMAKVGVPCKKLPVIKCECGVEILFVQQVELMGRAIEIHVEEHRATVSDPVEADAVSKHIEDYLIKQVLDKAAKKE
jgi:hypothetical protein